MLKDEDWEVQEYEQFIQPHFAPYGTLPVVGRYPNFTLKKGTGIITKKVEWAFNQCVVGLLRK